jgi:hypothetical protein
MVGINNVVRAFAQEPETLKVRLGGIKPPLIIMPALGMYEPETRTIVIDIRVVRGRWSLMKTLLHEICHHNQNVQGRLKMTKDNGNLLTYWFHAEEIEARGFARAWRAKAMTCYRLKIL